MLTIFLQILSLLGIILLSLLVLALTVLFLALFIPVTYRIRGAMDGKFSIDVRVTWFLGLFRIRCGYPDPGYITAKLLCFTLYKTKVPFPSDTKISNKGSADSRDSGNGIPRMSDADGRSAERTGADTTDSRSAESSVVGTSGADARSTEGSGDETGSTGTTGAETCVSGDSGEKTSFPENILKKFEKIKYTIYSIYDKIKKIWNNISYYVELLQEEETRQLFSHARLCLWKMGKSIRPRHIRADILFGTGAPDATGYLYGAYCMVAPGLGTGVCLTPDFQEKVLRGEFELSGCITMWILMWNILKLLLDKRLRMLIRKGRAAGKRQQKQGTAH